MITEHQYLDKHPIDLNATRLILGTIHPHQHEEFKMQFFYGSELSIWKILHQVFPVELPDPGHLETVKKFLQQRRLAISDTIVSCERIHPTALDRDLRVIKDNREILLSALKNSQIDEVLCTSGFGKNNAFQLFYCRILGQKITPEIRRSRQARFRLPGSHKEILIKVLYSPARTANRGIANSWGYKAVKDLMTVDEYRVHTYADALQRSSFPS
ncbi:MAG TPA: hypothetical protein VHB54_18615 [Mucilaginibacter sp.]|nr:hypothetical protein [Mucilaginibacter sp.]HVW99532.1 hypothetical protein [Candidatus Babeliaceae bacterium]